MSDLSSTLQYLYGLQKSGIKFGLENTLAMLEVLENPHYTFPTFHVAGTNGKGSVCAMLESSFRSAGYRTGLYTSPHVHRFTERIRVDGLEISENAVAKVTEMLRPVIDSHQGTFFEATTAMAFYYFASKQVDLGIIETGLGGRLDSTNVITPELSIITTIDLDHQEYLGKTITAIAAEKGGIIKPGISCLVGQVPQEAKQVLKAIALERRAPMYFFDEILVTENVRLSDRETTFDLKINLLGKRFYYKDVKLSLTGLHQVHNASLVLTAAAIQKRFTISEQALRLGLQRTVWPGRLQILREKPLILADGAHNPAGMTALRHAIETIYRPKAGRLFLMIGMLSDKDYISAVSAIAPVFDEIVTVKPHNPRAVDAGELAKIVGETNWNVSAGGTVAETYAALQKKLGPGDLLVITGSFYVLSEISNL